MSMIVYIYTFPETSRPQLLNFLKGKLLKSQAPSRLWCFFSVPWWQVPNLACGLELGSLEKIDGN